MLKILKRIYREKIIPYTSWLPRYYIFFKWAQIPPDAEILDIGCGEGYVSVKLAEKCKKVVGLDILPDDLKLAEDKKSRSKYKEKIAFISGDILKLPFSNESFDLVCLLDVLPHIDQAREALAEIGRILRPKGRVVITTPWQYPCAASLFKGQTWIRKIVPRLLYSDYRQGTKWLLTTNDEAKMLLNAYNLYDIRKLSEIMPPGFSVSAHGYFLKKYAALVTDLTYGIKGLWGIRSLFFWLAVRVDYYFSKNEPGYSIIAEFTKP